MKKLTIMSLDTGLAITAGFNPKELSFDKDSNWTDGDEGFHKNMNAMQWTTGKSIKMTVELFFDLYEQQGDVRKIIANLVSLTMMISDAKPRPHVVQLIWADSDILFAGGKFTGVVNSVNTKYTMFTNSGVPCRATATVTLTQAEDVQFSSGGDDADSSTKFNDHVPDNSAELEKWMNDNPDRDPVETSFKPAGMTTTEVPKTSNDSSNAG